MGWRCWEPRFDALPPETRVWICFGGLGMGDQAAVDIAQEAHRNGARSVGSLRPDEELLYPGALPAGPNDYWEGIMLDDHVGIQLAPLVDMEAWQREALDSFNPQRDRTCMGRAKPDPPMGGPGLPPFFRPSPFLSPRC